MADNWVPPEVAKAQQSTKWVPPEAAKMQTSTEGSGDDSGDGLGTDIARAIAPVVRGASPYVGGAALGAGAATVMGGPELAPFGAAAGAGAVGLTDLGISMYNPIARMTGMPQAPTATELVQNLLTKAGVPQSQGGLARTVEATTAGVGSALSGAGAAKQFVTPAVQRLAQEAPGSISTAQKILADLAAGPKAQAVAAGAGAAAGQATRELGGGPVTQWIASLLGGMAPGAATGAARRIPLGQSSELAAQQRVQQAREIGVEPDVAFAAPSMVSRAATRAMSGTESMQKHQAAVTRQLENEANRIADQLGKAQSPNAVGKVIQNAIGGDEGFLKRAAATEDTLWTKWFKQAESKGGGMPVNNTMAYLQKATADIPEAQEISQLLKDPYMQRVLQAFEKQTAPGQSQILDAAGRPIVTPGQNAVPYDAIKRLRSAVGERMTPGNMSPDVSQKALKGLYGALSQDIEAQAKALGPDAEKAFSRANMFTRGKHDRIETYLQEIDSKKPYQVWRYATNPDSVKDGGLQFLTLNRSMAPAERGVFHATFIKQMGRDETGAFNPRTFMANYDKLSPMVKAAILPAAQRPAMEKLMGVIRNLDKAGTLGQAKDSTPYLGAYMLMGALLHAHPKALLTVAFASSKSEKLGKMLTDPKIIDHISGVNKVPVEQATIALQALASTMKTLPTGEEE